MRRLARGVPLAAGLLFAASAFADDLPEDAPVDTEGPRRHSMRACEAPILAPLPEREHLAYSIEFGVIKAGTAVMEISRPPAVANAGLLDLTSRARSSPFFSRFYPVDDLVKSVADSTTLLPLRFEKRLSEGSYRAHESIYFDRDRDQAIYLKGDTIAVPPLAQDVLSAFYDVRRRELVPGTSVTFINHAGKKTVPIEVKVIGREMLDTRIGRFRCIKVQPVLARGGLFKNQGRIWVWFTDDERRIPVRMESKLAFGSIAAWIEKVERPDLALDARDMRRESRR
jgi:hypothetical protein